MAISPMEAAKALSNLWISPVALIHQVGRQPCLIIDFTWNGLNEATKCLSPMEAMHFGGALHRILKQVLTADPRLGPVYPSKVDLTDDYMRLWVRVEDAPSVAFLIPKKNHSDQQLVGFNLYLPTGYVDSAPYFCMATETVADLANEEIAQIDVASVPTPTGSGRGGQSGGKCRRAGGSS